MLSQCPDQQLFREQETRIPGEQYKKLFTKVCDGVSFLEHVHAKPGMQSGRMI